MRKSFYIKLINILILPFRKKRMAMFIREMNPLQTEKILDVGGTIWNWALLSKNYKVILLNIKPQGDFELPDNISFQIGDATCMDYVDKEFDIVFSNSVIEHVGSYAKQQDFAREVLRVGKRVWIQTPSRHFFFEPHYLTPFIHWLPKNTQKNILRNFSVLGWITRLDQAYIDNMVDQTRLLTLSELQELFPGCLIIKEKFLFMTKSFIVIKK